MAGSCRGPIQPALPLSTETQGFALGWEVAHLQCASLLDFYATGPGLKPFAIGPDSSGLKATAPFGSRFARMGLHPAKRRLGSEMVVRIRDAGERVLNYS
ncbi:hypothetical protein Terro_3756 [Terriglobus roseus DSM 18391]|uniref:Uncharacterized protein n=1 Tax=Terriglobus roseus (strain DSM 18391 / NRRL B-41598 / KBS 63) TaxID=926566 RepID=I3ZL49_TERRK|nr:hypothetical protein Terro_3756 [Terriglobus roseus DSM 18391]